MIDLINPEGSPKGGGANPTSAAERLNRELTKDRPGSESGSTPLDMAKMEKLMQGSEKEQREAAEMLLQQAMVQNNSPEVDVVPEVEKKAVTINKPIKELTTEPTQAKIKESNGFLMPFVNGFNGLLDGIWKVLTSWIPMKQTGTGTA